MIPREAPYAARSSSAILHERIREATEHGWLGKIEGLQVSLQAARRKAEQVRWTRTRATPIELGPTRITPPRP
jgi:hypothetical protein